MRKLIKSSGLAVALLLTVCASAQGPVDFTGHWSHETNSGSQRKLEIEQSGQSLRVVTVIIKSGESRRLEVKYQIGGPEVVYKGLDGDEFRTAVHWEGSVLVFDTIEHEDGNDIPQKTTWTLAGDRNTLQVERQMTKSGQTSPSRTDFVRQH
jgi:hypothetical protein